MNRTQDRSAGDGTLHLLQLCKHYGKFNDNQLLKTARAVLLASLNFQSRCHLLWHENFLTPYWNKKKIYTWLGDVVYLRMQGDRGPLSLTSCIAPNIRTI